MHHKTAVAQALYFATAASSDAGLKSVSVSNKATIKDQLGVFVDGLNVKSDGRPSDGAGTKMFGGSHGLEDRPTWIKT